MRETKPTYQELEARLAQMEETLEAIRRGEVDLLLGEKCPFVVRALETQKALEESEERFRSICQVVTDYIYSFRVQEDGSLKGEWVSESFEKAFGFTKEEIDERGGWQSMVYPEELPAMLEHARKVASGQVDIIETRFVTRSGEIRWIRDHTIPAWDKERTRVVRIYGAARDITDEKRALEAVDRSRRDLEVVLETAEALIVTVDPQGRILRFNRACEALTGYKREEVIGKPLLETLVPGPWRRVVQARFQDPTDPSLRKPHSNPWLTRSGEERMIEWRCSPVPAPDGEGFLIIGAGMDVTEKLKLEQELRDTSTLLSHVLSTSPIVTYVLTPEGESSRTTWISENIQEITGYSAQEATEPGWWEAHLHPEDREQAVGLARAMWSKGRRTLTHTYRFRRKDGEYMWVRDDIRILRDEKGQPVEAVGAWTDITEYKRAEEERQRLEAQFRQAQKMEAVGRLAGGVAHDFNNMLTVISGYAELALQRLKPADPLYNDIREILNAAVKSGELTRQLLAFSRKQIIAPRPLDLNEHLLGTEKMLRRIVGEDIVFKMALQEGVWPVFMDPAQLDQVVANLVVNARDAMPSGGSLLLETQNVVLDEEYCRTHPGSSQGEHVLLAVTDTGCGMDRETLERAFEPFYTTKGEGKGTGLGLATVYGIMKQNKGLVQLYSEPGQGTTVKLYLPLYRGQEQVGAREKVSMEEPRGSETVLLVEDEESLRKLARTMLQQLGYRVLEASGPGEALALCEKYEAEIHLLFTDVVMPLMNGNELSQRIRAVRPSVRALFMSGYTSNAISHHGVLAPGVALIQKPFNRQELARKVREVLDRA